MMNGNLLNKANQYIAENKGLVDRRYRPRFHAVAPIGWINDPNGFHFDGTQYHLFYQHYPYKAEWNDMHWGHWRSADLAMWEDLPVAMAPDRPYDEFGCFSGTALPDGKGGAHIMYTGVCEQGKLQQQCLAYFDGTNIVKSEKNPVIPFGLLPEGYAPQDFRDPKVFRTADGYRAIMAAKHEDGGRLVCFSSKDLENWKYEGVFCEPEGIMPECPDVFRLGGKTVVMYSKIGAGEDPEQNNRPVLCAVGDMNCEETSFTGGEWAPIDHGREFYAAQTCEGENGERIVTGWLASWEAQYPTARTEYGWSGMMTLPRVMKLKDGKIVQEPAPGFRKLRGEKKTVSAELEDNGVRMREVCAKHAEICFRAEVSDAESVTLNVMEDGEERVSLRWQEGRLTLDRSSIANNEVGKFVPVISMPVEAHDGQVEMTVFVDNCAVEVFANGQVMSAVAFPEGEKYGVSASAVGKAGVEIERWEIG